MKIIFKKLHLTVITTLCLLVVALCVSGGCDDKPQETDYPKEVPFTVYTSYNWDAIRGLWTNLEPSKVVVINSYEELTQYMASTDESLYPTVDFSKNSVLLVLISMKLEECNDDSTVEQLLLQQLSADKYKFSVSIMPSDTAYATPFFRSVAIMVNKMNKASEIELDVTVINYDSL